MQVSWIDPQDVAALAENLRTPPAVKPAPAPQPAAAPPAPSAAADSGLDALRAAFANFEATDMTAPLAEPADEVDLTESMESDPASPAADTPDGSHHTEAVPDHGEEASAGAMPDLSAFRKRLQAIRERAIGAGLLPKPSTASPFSIESTPAAATPIASNFVQHTGDRAEPKPEADWTFEVPLGSVQDRLQAFAIWARAHVDRSEILVVDDHGDLLWGQHARQELILSTLMARNAATRASPLSICGEPAVVHYWLSPEVTLTVIPCDTRLGRIQIVMTAPEPLHAADADRLRQALAAAMDAPD